MRICVIILTRSRITVTPMASLAKATAMDIAAAPRGGARSTRRVAGLYAVFVLLVLGLIELQPRAGADVALLAAPWSAPGRAALIAASADGDVVSATRWPFVIIAHPRARHFTASAYAHGAWLVFDAGLIAGCRPPRGTAL